MINRKSQLDLQEMDEELERQMLAMVHYPKQNLGVFQEMELKTAD